MPINRKNSYTVFRKEKWPNANTINKVIGKLLESLFLFYKLTHMIILKSIHHIYIVLSEL